MEGQNVGSRVESGAADRDSLQFPFLTLQKTYDSERFPCCYLGSGDKGKELTAPLRPPPPPVSRRGVGKNTATAE